MASERQHAHDLLDRIPTEQMNSAVRFLEFLLLDPVARSAATAPPDDEPLAEEDRRRVVEGKSWLAGGGQGAPMESVLAEFGLKPGDFPMDR
jgi:hypothetical protein